jgi:hypothetical protein
MKIRGKRLFLAAAAVYLAWLGWQALAFRKYVSTDPSEVQASEVSAPPELFEARGAYHVHSKFSDGRKSVDGIARAASRAGLDFLILADHGSPNRDSLAAQGRKSGVHVLAGTEISTSRGHLVALDFAPGTGSFSQDAENAAREVRALGGFTVIAHPYSKTRWSWGDAHPYDGLEIIDGDSMLKRNWPKALVRLPLYLFKPEIVLLEILSRPRETLRKWDELLLGRESVLGFFSVDAHFLYGSAFEVFRIHVLLAAPLPEDFEIARGRVFTAIRAGSFFCAVDAAADPAGFRFWTDAAGALRVRAPFSFAHETRIIREGRSVASSTARDLTFEAREPGAYRVEVYLRERSPLAGDVPWIVSNPVLVRSGGKEAR